MNKFISAVVVSFVFVTCSLHADIRVVDDLNRTVYLKAPAKRVIALAPHIVENIYAIGAGDTLVGAVDHSDFPESALSIPRVGNYTTISIESIVAAQPDLILAWKSGNAAAPLKKLGELGYPVYVGDINKMKDISASLRDYGVLLGRSDEANRVAKRFDKHIATLSEQYANKKTVSVFYQVWNAPLQTLNGDALISEVIRLCGGKNVFSDLEGIAPLVSVESVIAANPELIVASGMGEERPEWLDDWRKYTMIDAVKSDHLVHIHPDILQRHTLRIRQGTEEMCRAVNALRD